ncbi:glycosyltransferase [Salegentibacter sp. BDJ18]|nr:glycosyltransferase [Salegentibacter sp. BDJ18]
MNLWLQHVDEVEVVAPLNKKKNRFAEIPYEHEKLKFISIPSVKFLSPKNIISSFSKLPLITYMIYNSMAKTGHIHLRCPGNIGLIASVIQIFFPDKPKTVKYAGNWDPKAKQPWTYKLQQKILSNTFLSKNIQVLVYGDWQGNGKNIVPFFTASFSKKDKEVIEKDFTPRYKFIYTGNLVEGKGVFEAIKLIETLNDHGVFSEIEIFGDGILKNSLSDYIQRNELQEFVKLKGRKSLEELKEAYKDAHFVILLSKSEGWPKAIAEGMWYGCVPIATPVSCVPWMLGNGSRGILICDVEKREEKKEKRGESLDKRKEKRSVLLNDESEKNRQFECSDGSRDVSRTEFFKDDLASLTKLLKHPEKLKQMSIAAQEWSQQYTLERFETEIKKLLVPKKA